MKNAILESLYTHNNYNLNKHKQQVYKTENSHV